MGLYTLKTVNLTVQNRYHTTNLSLWLPCDIFSLTPSQDPYPVKKTISLWWEEHPRNILLKRLPQQTIAARTTYYILIIFWSQLMKWAIAVTFKVNNKQKLYTKWHELVILWNVPSKNGTEQWTQYTKPQDIHMISFVSLI